MGCRTSESRVVYVTATVEQGAAATLDVTPVLPTVMPAQNAAPTEVGVLAPAVPRQHVVQSGDTLSAIAAANNTTVDTLLRLNQLADPNIISVGQVLVLPELPSNTTPNLRLLADSLLVRGPGSSAFDVAGFIASQPGFIRTANDRVATRLADGDTAEEILSAAEVVTRVSLEFSVDARLLLALVEYRAGWLSNPAVTEDLKTYPMISREDSEPTDRSGLYRQLAWTANELNRGYYGWKYNGWTTIEFEEGERFLYNETLNAATIGLQYMLHLNRPYSLWLFDVGTEGFYTTYTRYFGDPTAQDRGDPVPTTGLVQPDLQLPFAQGETWFYTGGPHGGWGTGSAWSAVDFAPPDDRTDGVFCYTSQFWATAVASGVIERSHEGVVVLDLDGDGDESTGWTVLYLHLASEDRVAPGTRVNPGDRIGHPSCEGGFSTATHMHLARRYNGEWLPSDCHGCKAGISLPPFTMSGWTVVGIRNQEYQGFIQTGGSRQTAEQGRNTPINRVSW